MPRQVVDSDNAKASAISRALRRGHSQWLSLGIILSIISLVTSIGTLWVTYTSQDLDRFYREVSIRPHLVFYTDDENTTLRIRNDGTGPADVSFFHVFGGKHTSSLQQPNPESFMADIRDIFQAKAVEMLSGVVEYDLPFERYVATDNYSIASINSGANKILLKIDRQGLLKELQAKDIDFPLFMQTNVSYRIDHAIELMLGRYRLQTCYCSITGAFCEDITTGSADLSDQDEKCEEKGKLYESPEQRIYNRITSILEKLRIPQK